MAHWNEAYWAVHSQYYWSPSLLGFSSTKISATEKKSGMVAIEAENLQRATRLYWRRADENMDATQERLKKQEVVLNHGLWLLLMTAPDDLLQRLLIDPFGGCQTAHGLEVLSPELWCRYGWPRGTNVTQPDALCVSPDAVIAVEIKLNADTSPGQVLKYAALMAMEERLSGPKSHLHLLYITPEARRKAVSEKIAIDGNSPGAVYLHWSKSLRPDNMLSDFVKTERILMESVLERMRIAIISWTEVAARLEALAADLDLTHRGDQTLHRLIAGFLDHLGGHQKTGLGAPHWTNSDGVT